MRRTAWRAPRSTECSLFLGAYCREATRKPAVSNSRRRAHSPRSRPTAPRRPEGGTESRAAARQPSVREDDTFPAKSDEDERRCGASSAPIRACSDASRWRIPASQDPAVRASVRAIGPRQRRTAARPAQPRRRRSRPHSRSKPRSRRPSVGPLSPRIRDQPRDPRTASIRLKPRPPLRASAIAWQGRSDRAATRRRNLLRGIWHDVDRWCRRRGCSAHIRPSGCGDPRRARRERARLARLIAASDVTRRRNACPRC